MELEDVLDFNNLQLKTDKQLFCIQCNNPREKGRRYCRNCYLENKRKYAKERYLKNGGYNYGKSKCIICNKEITLWKKDQLFCKNCVMFSTSDNGDITNQYERAHGHGFCFMHRRVASETLGRKLDYNEIVHHLDGNPNNNDKNNLIVISRSLHMKLHRYLGLQRAILEKSNNANYENCWKDLRVPITTAWLEMTNANVIKIWEIGESASELLSQ
jgi:hypothetical protein